MSAPTRRGLLAGAVTLVPLASVLPLAALPATPDAVLLILCADAIAAEAAFSAFLRDTPERSGGFRAEEERQVYLLAEFEHRIAGVPAQTFGGLRAKVLAARAAYPSGLNSEVVAESILDDVLALAGRASA